MLLRDVSAKTAFATTFLRPPKRGLLASPERYAKASREGGSTSHLASQDFQRNQN